MKFTKIERTGDISVEHVIEGDYEEVLALFTEIQSSESTIEYHGEIPPWKEGEILNG